MNKSKFLVTFVLLVACIVATVQPTSVAAAAPTRVEKTSLSSVATASLPGVRFVHSATTSNTASNWTALDHPLLNGNPNAIFLVTQNWNPGGGIGTYNNNEIGVYYGSGQWRIFNQNTGSPMLAGADFNIFVPDTGSHVFVHTAVASNTIGNYTIINHTLLNNNPNALVLVTQNWNPGGGVFGIFNNHPIGVFYAGGMWRISNYDGVDMPMNASFNIVVANPASTAFVHKATADNISSHTTAIDHPLLNGNPNALVLVTQNWNPGGVGGTYNSHPIGVYYASGKWRIFNQDFFDMPPDASFNVLIPDTRTDVFVHKRSSSDVSYATLIDHPLLNNNPNAIFLVTPNWNPGGGSGGTYNDRVINVWYNALAGKWLIRNQDSAAMSVGASFNVLIPPPGANVFVHKATASNISLHITTLDHPLLNGNPNAIFLVTQNYNPGGGVSGTFNNHPIGVFYSGGVWSIFNQDLAGMPVGASFNVLVLNDLTALPGSKAAFVHTATSGGNISSNWTALNHALSNGTPPALVFATDNYNPGGGGSGVYNNHNTGVWYTGGSAAIPNRWAIFNQDGVAMPNSAGFNVLVMVQQVYLPLVIRQ